MTELRQRVETGLEGSNRLDQVAVLVSHLLNPALVAWWVFTTLMWTAGADWVAGGIGLAFYAVIPGLAMLFLFRNGIVQEFYPGERDQRGRLLILGTVCYLLGFIALGIYGASHFMVGAGCAYFLNALLVWQINRYWKISIHAVGVSGGILILLEAMGGEFWPFVLALPLVAWARLRLKSHTPAQVVVGGLLGGISTGLVVGAFGRF